MKCFDVLVYPGFAHWHKPIEEIEECFYTREEAENYIAMIRRCEPHYYFEIIERKL